MPNAVCTPGSKPENTLNAALELHIVTVRIDITFRDLIVALQVRRVDIQNFYAEISRAAFDSVLRAFSILNARSILLIYQALMAVRIACSCMCCIDLCRT